MPPSVLLFGENRTNRLPTIIEEKKPSEIMRQACERDAKVKAKAKAYTDRKRKAKEHDFVVGDTVLSCQKRTSKTMTKFGRESHTVTAVKGSMISVRADNDGREFTRDASKFKRLHLRSEEDADVLDLGNQAQVNPAPVVNDSDRSAPAVDAVPAEALTDTNVPLRRSERQHRQPERLGISGK